MRQAHALHICYDIGPNFYSYSDETTNPDCQPTILSAKTPPPPLSPQAHSFFAQLILRPLLLQATKGLVLVFLRMVIGFGCITIRGTEKEEKERVWWVQTTVRGAFYFAPSKLEGRCARACICSDSH